MPRVFVRDFSKTTVKSDLELLFSKLCPVDDVYVPLPTVTGINRNFAIVTLDCTDEIAEKCIKAFHNSNWNGSRIRVELANTWYKNKFENEKLIESTVHIPAQIIVNDQPVVVCKNIVTLKRSYMLPLIKISLKPRKSAGVQSKRKNVVACGVRTVLDDSCITSSDELSSDSESEDEQIVPLIASTPLLPSPISSAKAIVIPTTSAPASHLQGGGSRKGFGTLLTSTAKLNTAIKVPSSKSLKKTVSDDTKVERFDEYSNGGLDNDSGISDGEYDDDSDMDGERCVAPGELDESALIRERQRAIALMQSVLGGGEVVKSDVNSTTVTENKIVSVSSQPDSFDTTSNSGGAGGSGSMVSRNGWNSVVMVRFNPGKSKVAKIPSDSTVPPDATKNVPMEVQVNEVVISDPVPPAPVSVLDSSKGAEVVQLDKLKNIFYKEGGVWWDDSGSVTTGEAVLRGTVDPLFLEAEKFGIDIRSNTKSNDDSADSGMLFGFFEKEEVVDMSTPTIETSVAASDEKATDHSNVVFSTTDSHNFSAGTKRKLTSMSLQDMILTANKFCRVRSVEEINKDWIENRDKLVLDYKRKFKDARKRNNGVVISETVPTTIRTNKILSAHAKSKSRGGVKHSRKKS